MALLYRGPSVYISSFGFDIIWRRGQLFHIYAVAVFFPVHLHEMSMAYEL